MHGFLTNQDAVIFHGNDNTVKKENLVHQILRDLPLGPTNLNCV